MGVAFYHGVKQTMKNFEVYILASLHTFYTSENAALENTVR